MSRGTSVDSAQANEYASKGHTCFEGYLSSTELDGVAADFAGLIKLQMGAAGLDVSAGPSPSWYLSEGTMQLAAKERKRVGFLYDSCMKLCSLRALAVSERLLALPKQLLGVELLSMSNNIQVRIDLPTEDRFLFRHWHQDYTSGMTSLHGLSLWIPLLPITEEMGPVEVLDGSHRDGLRNSWLQDGRYYNTEITDESEAEEFSARPYDAGDVLAFDLMTIHRSGLNRSSCPRWTICFRYCDMSDEKSVASGWPSYYSQGSHFRDVHPEKMVEVPPTL